MVHPSGWPVSQHPHRQKRIRKMLLFKSCGSLQQVSRSHGGTDQDAEVFHLANLVTISLAKPGHNPPDVGFVQNIKRTDPDVLPSIFGENLPIFERPQAVGLAPELRQIVEGFRISVDVQGIMLPKPSGVGLQIYFRQEDRAGTDHLAKLLDRSSCIIEMLEGRLGED